MAGKFNGDNNNTSINQHHRHHQTDQLLPESHSDDYQRAINQLTSVTIRHTGRGMGIRNQHQLTPSTFTDSRLQHQQQLTTTTLSNHDRDFEDDDSHDSESFVLQTQDSVITNVSTNQLAHPDTITPTVTTVPSSQHQPTISTKFAPEQVQKLMI